jgi:putative hydrolase of the HAD superfamily
MQAKRSFGHIETWVFDLDNTLYPHHVNLWQQVDARIGAYIGNFLKVGPVEARRIQKDYYRRYGTSMRGMMTEHGVRADDYLAYVHQIDHSPLEPNPAMGAAIAALPGRKLILTNGSRKHATLTTEALGLGASFEDIFDIIDAELVPKPELRTYQRFFDKHHVDPETAVMFEDIERNLIVPHQRGMKTVLVVPRPGQTDHREPFEIPGSLALPHVDFVTSDLGGFLVEILAERAAGSH